MGCATSQAAKLDLHGNFKLIDKTEMHHPERVCHVEPYHKVQNQVDMLRMPS